VGVWATKGEGEEAVLCCKYCDLTDFNYFTRGKVEAIFALRTFVVLVSLPRLMRRTRHHLQEFDTFVSRTVVERTPVGMRQAVRRRASPTTIPARRR